MQETRLRDYLCDGNLWRIDPALKFVEKEHVFPGGRIDILARRDNRNVAIELKSHQYTTQRVCAQLMNYNNYIAPGLVYFVAPKVKYGVYSTLQQYGSRLLLYEIEGKGDDLIFHKRKPADLDDARPFPEIGNAQHDDLFGVARRLVRRGIERYTVRGLRRELLLGFLDRL